MRKRRAATVFLGTSTVLAISGAATGFLFSGPRFTAVVLGVGMGLAATVIGFFVLLQNLERSGERFLGAWGAGVLIRFLALGVAFGLAAAQLLPAAPLLIAMGLTVFVLLVLESLVLLTAGGEGNDGDRGDPS